MFDLSNPQDRKQLSAQIQNEIDQYCADKYNDGHRNHLGASVIGEPCSRKIWYQFRWVKKEIHSGRVQRIFQVGHNAEPRFAEYLQGNGWNVELIDPNTNKQYRFNAHNGHFGGSLDGIIWTRNYRMLVEFKTNGTGAGYNDVGKLGVQKAKPKHWDQMCVNGYQWQIQYGLYLIENKNDSDITPEIVELDLQRGEQLTAKAGDIINDPYPPTRIAENPAFYECKFCAFQDICHHGECVEQNCRSCRYSKPVENAAWYCQKHEGIIPPEFIPIGCKDHVTCNGE